MLEYILAVARAENIQAAAGAENILAAARAQVEEIRADLLVEG